MLFEENLYAAAAAPAAGAPASGPSDPASMFMSFLPLILIFVLFYFMFIVPQRKEQKKHQEMLKTLKPGDKIITSGGIVGIIDKIVESEDIIRIKSGESTLLNMKRSHVASRVDKLADQQPEEKK